MLTQLYLEGLAAAALALDIWVVEFKPLIQTLSGEVELGAVDKRQALRVYENRDTMTGKSNVIRNGSIDKLKFVGQP